MKDKSAHSRIDGLEIVVANQLESITSQLEACVQTTNAISDSVSQLNDAILVHGWHSAFVTNIKAMNPRLSFLDPGDIQSNIQKLCEEHIRLSAELDEVFTKKEK